MAAPLPMILLADIWDVLGPALALLLPLLWGIKQIADAAKQGQPAEGQPAAPPRQPAEPAGPPRQAAGQQADPLRSQVEEFLRRSGRAPQAQREPPARRDIEVLVDERPPRAAEEPPRRPAAAPATPVVPPSKPPAPDPTKPARRSVSPKKRKTLAERAVERAAARSRNLADPGSRLGQRIIEEDHQFDVQLKAKFDHTVGTLAGSAAPTSEQVPAPPETPASQIAAMLASPAGVRQAIILNEILNRPSDRW